MFLRSSERKIKDGIPKSRRGSHEKRTGKCWKELTGNVETLK